MSTIFVDSVAGQGGGTETNLMAGLAKARLTYDHVNTTIDDSENVSSVTDRLSGNLTVNFSNAFANAFMSHAGLAGQSPGPDKAVIRVEDNVTAVTSSAVPLAVGDAAADTDQDLVTYQAFGDLA